MEMDNNNFFFVLSHDRRINFNHSNDGNGNPKRDNRTLWKYSLVFSGASTQCSTLVDCRECFAFISEWSGAVNIAPHRRASVDSVIHDHFYVRLFFQLRLNSEFHSMGIQMKQNHHDKQWNLATTHWKFLGLFCVRCVLFGGRGETMIINIKWEKELRKSRHGASATLSLRNMCAIKWWWFTVCCTLLLQSILYFSLDWLYRILWWLLNSQTKMAHIHAIPRTNTRETEVCSGLGLGWAGDGEWWDGDSAIGHKNMKNRLFTSLIWMSASSGDCPSVLCACYFSILFFKLSIVYIRSGVVVVIAIVHSKQKTERRRWNITIERAW